MRPEALAGALEGDVGDLLERLLGGCPRLVVRVPGPPIAKERARTYVDQRATLPPELLARLHPIAARAAARPRVRTKTPKTTEAYEAHVRRVAHLACLEQHWPTGGFEGARYVMSALYVVRNDQQDDSNLLKSTEDAFNKVVWKDDRYLAHAWSVKRLFGPGDLPRAEVKVWALGPTGGGSK